MIQQVTEWLIQRGYALVDQETDGLLFRETQNQVYAITLSYAGTEDDSEEYVMIERRVEFMLATRFAKRVECLHIVFTKDGMFDDIEHKLLDKLNNIWFVACDTGRVFIFENQIVEFDNLNDDLERVMESFVKKRTSKATFRLTPVNTGIIVLNVLCFLAVIIVHKDLSAVYSSSAMLSMGALSYETFMDGAWYQIITAMFLHFGLEHLGNNMLILACTGYELEKRIGSISYFFIYFLSGIAGSIASLVYYHSQNEIFVGAGASGAIFGVIGALWVVFVMRQLRTPDLSPTKIFIMLVISIYHGLTSTGVGNAAHIGGLFAGVIGGFLLSKISQYVKLERVNFMR